MAYKLLVKVEMVVDKKFVITNPNFYVISVLVSPF